jgi:hypothetical protein
MCVSFELLFGLWQTPPEQTSRKALANRTNVNESKQRSVQPIVLRDLTTLDMRAVMCAVVAAALLLVGSNAQATVPTWIEGCMSSCSLSMGTAHGLVGVLLVRAGCVLRASSSALRRVRVTRFSLVLIRKMIFFVVFGGVDTPGVSLLFVLAS